MAMAGWFKFYGEEATVRRNGRITKLRLTAMVIAYLRYTLKIIVELRSLQVDSVYDEKTVVMKLLVPR